MEKGVEMIGCLEIPWEKVDRVVGGYKAPLETLDSCWSFGSLHPSAAVVVCVPQVSSRVLLKMFGEWRVCLVILVLWCGSSSRVSGGDLEILRPQYLRIIGTGQGENKGCREASTNWYEGLSVLAGLSGDQLVKETRAAAADGLQGFSDEAVAGGMKHTLNDYDVAHSEDTRCIVTEGLVCSGGKCVKCDKAEDKTTCGFIKTIVDKEASSKKSEGSPASIKESLRPKFLELVGTGHGETENCREAPEYWYEHLAALTGKSGDQMVKDTRDKSVDGFKEASDERIARAVRVVLDDFDRRHSKDKRCIATKGLVCVGGMCVKCFEAERTCGFIRRIADEEGSQASSKKSEGGRVKTPVGVVVVSLVIVFG